MATRLMTCAIVALLTASASAQLRLFLSTTGAGETEPLAESPGLENPQVASPGTLYIYAQMFAGPEAWNGISLDLKVTGGTIIDWRFYDYANGGLLRWDYVGQGALGSNDTRVLGAYGLAYPTGVGVQNDPQFDALDLHYWPDADATLLGWVKVLVSEEAEQAELFLAVGSLGIIKAGTSSVQGVYLGFDDEDDGLRGNSYHVFSSQADATVTNACHEILRGDANCDGVIDAFDIDPFTTALTDPEAYAAQFPDCNGPCACDIDRNGQVDAFDVDPFVACLTGGCP